jgi:hypothetical protein
MKIRNKDTSFNTEQERNKKRVIFWKKNSKTIEFFKNKNKF